MTTEPNRSTKSVAFIEHLARFPEDLRDIRRLQRRYALTVAEAALALDGWRRALEPEEPAVGLSH
jgi:hypothetical protein